MASFRLSRLAEVDLTRILATSEERWGLEARRRYEAIMISAMRKVAADPDGPTTQNRAELSSGIRCFHLRHARGHDQETKVRQPVHVIYYRLLSPDLIEIIRVLHERMEPSRRLGPI